MRSTCVHVFVHELALECWVMTCSEWRVPSLVVVGSGVWLATSQDRGRGYSASVHPGRNRWCSWSWSHTNPQVVML